MSTRPKSKSSFSFISKKSPHDGNFITGALALKLITTLPARVTADTIADVVDAFFGVFANHPALVVTGEAGI